MTAGLGLSGDRGQWRIAHDAGELAADVAAQPATFDEVNAVAAAHPCRTRASPVGHALDGVADLAVEVGVKTGQHGPSSPR